MKKEKGRYFYLRISQIDYKKVAAKARKYGFKNIGEYARTLVLSNKKKKILQKTAAAANKKDSKIAIPLSAIEKEKVFAEAKELGFKNTSEFIRHIVLNSEISIYIYCQNKEKKGCR